jgi:hypothetical protein
MTFGPGMKRKKIEKILATEEELAPSSGFVSSVMERIAEEAAAPPPIPFPWKRAVPGIVLVSGVLGWGAFELVRAGIRSAPAISMPAIHLSASMQRPLEQAGWVALALGISLASWVISKAMAGRSGLL